MPASRRMTAGSAPVTTRPSAWKDSASASASRRMAAKIAATSWRRSSSGTRTTMPKSSRMIRPSSGDVHVARMRVGVEEPVHEHHLGVQLHDVAHEPLGTHAPFGDPFVQPIDSPARAVLQHQRALPDHRLDDARDPDAARAGEVRADRHGVRRPPGENPSPPPTRAANSWITTRVPTTCGLGHHRSTTRDDALARRARPPRRAPRRRAAAP